MKYEIAMKKIYILALACVALASCSKETLDQQPKGEPFVKGQKITFTVGSGVGSKVTSEVNEGDIEFKWEEDDKILVKVGSESAEFTIKKGAGTASAVFEGEMPEGGESFDVQYPVEAPSITSQAYTTEEAFEHDKMLFEAKNCVVVNNTAEVTLKAAYSVLNLNFYGADLWVNSVTVTLGETDCTLSCGEGQNGVDIGDTKENATAFRIIVPTGTYANFRVNIGYTYDSTIPIDYGSYGKGTPITKHIFNASTSNTFNAGEIVNMQEREMRTVIWAPVNCGYSSTTNYGKYYQFGRKVGGGSSDDAASTRLKESTATTTGRRTKPDSGTFYCSENDWYTTTKANQLTKWPLVAGDAGYSEGYIQNPCPSGWTVPSRQDLADLLGGCTDDSGFQKGSHGSLTNVNGRYFNGTDEVKPTTGVFLPAASYIQCNGGTSAYKRGNSLDYWSANVKDNGSSEWNKAYFLRFAKQSGKSTMGPHIATTESPAYGFSVRCVQTK